MADFFSPEQKINRLCRADVQGQDFGHNFQALVAVVLQPIFCTEEVKKKEDNDN